MPRPACVLALIALLAGCGSKPGVAPDPLLEVKNPRLRPERRALAIEAAWGRVLEGAADRAAVRTDLKTLAWSPNWPVELRLKALRTVLGDTDPAGEADSRQLVRLMVPREKDPQVIDLLSQIAGDRGWTEAVPALIRSLSRPDTGTKDTERAEYRAIAKLAPERPVELTVVQTFLHPPPEEGAYGLSSVELTRADAWTVLGRLDPSRALRMSMLENNSDDPDVASIKAAVEQLRAAPRTGGEFVWLRSLRDPSNRLNGEWWREASAAVAAMGPERAPTLQLRHAEVIRWATAHRPNWARASRQELLSELRGRLAGRTTHWRTAKERLGDRSQVQSLEMVEQTISWADLLTVLVLDDAVHDPAVVTALFAQAALDRKDKSAEYGGIVEDMPMKSGEGAVRVVMFPPRPGARRGDKEFVASTDMMAQSDRSLAHYHFHVQEAQNSSFAGPSTPDLAYADRLGRNCLVLTSIGKDTMDVDYYQPGGLILDLGEIERP
ncbi:MAG: hypothetical protein IT437_02270 [Phycisphaerales bacterium]|nr:hypothetical protein [Phycisphaerales bacterium]